jgi:ADP-heptose:LPS heptosyltransferase
MESFATNLETLLRRMGVTADYLAWLLLDPSKFTIINKEKIKKVLVIHLGAIGEVIISTPIIPALKKSLKAQIVYMVSPGKEVLLENNPYVNKVLTYQDNFWKNVDALKKEKFDIVFIIYPSSQKLALECLLAGIKYRIGGFKAVKSPLNLLLTRKMLDFRKKHAVHCNLDVIRTIGIDNKNPELELHVPDIYSKKINNLLKQLKIKDFVIIHQGSSFLGKLKYPSRLWPLDRYAKVADFISKNYNVKILITGAPGETPFTNELIKQIKDKRNVIDLSEKLNLGDMMALVSRAKLLIAPSTGIAHIAAALGTPMVHLSGPDGYHWQPWAKKGKCIAIQHLEVCTGCNTIICRKKNTECLKAITVSDVTQAAKHFLDIRNP